MQKEKNVKKKRQSKIGDIVSIGIAIILIFLLFIFKNEFIEYEAEIQVSYGEEALTNYNNVLKDTYRLSPSKVEFEEPEEVSEEENLKKREITPYFENMRKEYDNEDIIGELIIEDTTINYPVVQTDDNIFYLERDINKNSSNAGWLFLDYENDVFEQDKNQIIYGHNMKENIMFHSIRYYRDKEFFENHRYIIFNTIYDTQVWEVFSFYKADDSFPYIVVNFENDQQFAALADAIKEKSFYDTGVEVSGEDRILSLSTCTNQEENTRYVLSAKLIETNYISPEHVKDN